MNRRGLKAASRASIRDAAISPFRVTLVYLLVSNAIFIAYNLYVYYLGYAIDQSGGGLWSLQQRNRYNLWLSLLPIIINLLIMLWDDGYLSFTLHISRGQHAAYDDLLDGYRIFGKFLLLGICKIAMIFLWSLLLVIPGIIAYYRYSMAEYALLHNPHLSAGEALAESSRLTYGHKMELFMLDISFLGYYLLGLAFSGIAYLNVIFTTPLLPGPAGDIGLYLISTLLLFLWNLWLVAYVQTTHAHAFNWMKTINPDNYTPYPPVAPPNSGW